MSDCKKIGLYLSAVYSKPQSMLLLKDISSSSSLPAPLPWPLVVPLGLETSSHASELFSWSYSIFMGMLIPFSKTNTFMTLQYFDKRNILNI